MSGDVLLSTIMKIKDDVGQIKGSMATSTDLTSTEIKLTKALSDHVKECPARTPSIIPQTRKKDGSGFKVDWGALVKIAGIIAAAVAAAATGSSIAQ